MVFVCLAGICDTVFPRSSFHTLAIVIIILQALEYGAPVTAYEALVQCARMFRNNAVRPPITDDTNGGPDLASVSAPETDSVTGATHSVYAFLARPLLFHTALIFFAATAL